MATQKKTDIIATLEDYNKKLPVLPVNAREILVKITPWFALIFGILGIVGSLAAFGLVTAFSPALLLSGGTHTLAGTFISAAIALVGSVLLLAAFPGTKAKKEKGWKLLFWSEVVSLIASVISLSVGGIVVGLIAFYLLFQIKSYYK